MGRRRKSQALWVAMNGHMVGRWTRASGGAQAFQYDPAWLTHAAATPISLTMPLSSDPHDGAQVGRFFDNLLPDAEHIRRRMQTALGTATAQPFDLLAAAGGDCIGAIQIFATPDMPEVRTLEASAVTDAEIAAILRGYRSRPLGMTPSEDDFRISMAGAQEKTAFLWHNDSWHRPHGTTPTSHIFKLPIGRIEHANIDLSDSVGNEWLCLALAGAFGLPVAQAEVHTFEGTEVLVAERFDRVWANDHSWLIRLPQEDMCQALGVPPSLKYQADGGPGMASILDVLFQSTNPHEDRRAFFRANVVLWMLGAIDGHAKNFSIFLYPGGRIRLTPLYDILSAYPLIASRQLAIQKIKMAMAVDGKNRHYRWNDIERRHWLNMATKCRFPVEEAEVILADCVARTEPAIEQVRPRLPPSLPAEVAEATFNGLRQAARKLA